MRLVVQKIWAADAVARRLVLPRRPDLSLPLQTMLTDHPNEDATSFGHALKQLGVRAYPTFSVVEVEKAIVEQIVEGLSDDRTCSHLRLQKLAMLEKWFILARGVEQCYR